MRKTLAFNCQGFLFTVVTIEYDMQESTKDGTITFYASSRQAWREWLLNHHTTESSVWLIIYKKASKVPSVSYKEAVKEALCFGWIDSKPNKRDEKSYYQYFSKRNPKSNWSGLNKTYIKELAAQGLMQPAGIQMVELARQTGTWTALDSVTQLLVPEDLAKAFVKYPQAKKHFDAFPASVKKSILEWILNAKRATTRTKRIEETARLAAKNIRANQYKSK